MLFQKQDLTGNHYDWSDAGNELFTGQPSRRSFDRFNGDQVLFLINYYGSIADKFSVEKGKIVEQRLLHDLPSELKSEISVINWIKTEVLATP